MSEFRAGYAPRGDYSLGESMRLRAYQLAIGRQYIAMIALRDSSQGIEAIQHIVRVNEIRPYVHGAFRLLMYMQMPKNRSIPYNALMFDGYSILFHQKSGFSKPSFSDKDRLTVGTTPASLVYLRRLDPDFDQELDDLFGAAE